VIKDTQEKAEKKKTEIIQLQASAQQAAQAQSQPQEAAA
jgi:hypothetical protein